MTKVVYEDKWIKIVHKESKPKTDVFDVYSKCQNLTIGEIKWDVGWRHYVWQDSLIKLSDRCLFSLGYFVMKKNIAHKGKKQFVEEFIEMMDEEFGKNSRGYCMDCREFHKFKILRTLDNGKKIEVVRI